MDLYVVRHAIAEERDAERWPDDARRPLTSRGRERFAPVAGLLGRLAPDVDVLLTSRYVRALQTAEILVARAGWPSPRPCPELEFAAPTEVCAALRRHAGASAVAVVGHEPALSELIGFLLAGDEVRVAVEMKKGGAVGLGFKGAAAPGAGTLRWYVTPKVARAAEG